jgi:plasmid stabilization system protein ParE
MSHDIVFLQSAAEDLMEIRRYIRRHFSERTWARAYTKIKKAIQHLEKFPYSGHAPAELPAGHFLEIIAVKNRVIYQVVGTTVYIHIVCDSRQDFKTRLQRRPLRPLLPRV